MKNIAVLTVLVITLCRAPFAFSQEDRRFPYAFTAGTMFGMLAGQAEEIVYPSPEYKAEKLSQLLWDMKPVFYQGLSLDFSRARPMEKWGFFSALSLKYAIPGISGKMEDRDWLSKENSGLTHYSVHDNRAGRAFLLDFNAGLSLPVKNTLIIKPYLGLSYMHFDFTAMNGHGIYARDVSYGNGIYAPIDDSPDYISFTGEKVINYAQYWLIASPGISLGCPFLDRFYAELFVQLSPFVWCNDIDQHLGRNIEFRDYMRGGLFAEPGLRLACSFGGRLELGLDFSWRFIGGARGETWQASIGSDEYSAAGEAGAGLSVFDAALRLKMRF